MNRPRRSGLSWRALAAAALLLALSAGLPSGASAETTIYRCTGADGRVTFTDERCADGVRLDVRAGQADPAAIARLNRELEAFDRRDAQRRAALREAEAWRLELESRRMAQLDARFGPPPTPWDGGVCTTCGGLGWYVPVLPPLPPKPPPFRPRPPAAPSYLDFGIRR